MIHLIFVLFFPIFRRVCSCLYTSSLCVWESEGKEKVVRDVNEDSWVSYENSWGFVDDNFTESIPLRRDSNPVSTLRVQDPKNCYQTPIVDHPVGDFWNIGGSTSGLG